MAFFAIPYTVTFEDTMAYGTHHFLTNLRFQCAVREHLIFDHLLRKEPVATAELDDIVMLTREGYTRNYAPVALGQRVAVLLSFAEPTRSSLRLCVRSIRQDGEPVAAGFQTVVFTRRDGSLAPIPAFMDAFLSSEYQLAERRAAMPYAQAAVAGARTSELFPAELRDLAQTICRTSNGGWIVGQQTETRAATLDSGDVLLFPGQGSFDGALLRALAAGEHAAEAVRAADIASREVLDASFADFAAATNIVQSAMLADCPDLDQFGILLTGVLLANRLRDAGLRPGAFAGHSFGEITALCAAGTLDLAGALSVVSERIRALRRVGVPDGGMLAVAADRTTVEAALDADARRAGCRVGVINHDRQAVISGPGAELVRLKTSLSGSGHTAFLLAARQPFHSALLGSAARLVGENAAAPSRDAPVPVYSPILDGFYADGLDLGLVLSSQLTRQVDFPSAVRALAAAGATRFIECGSGSLAKFVARTSGVTQPAVAAARSAASLDEDVRAVARGDVRSNLRRDEATRLTAVGEQVARPATSVKPARTDAPPTPVAIVAMGAVLPGAANVPAFWRSLVEGRSGIVDLRTVDPDFERDFMAAGVTPDKTYSPLSGFVAEELLPPRSAEAASKAERLLEAALDQIAATWRRPPGTRASCLLGATADGLAEYDESRLVQGAIDLAATLPSQGEAIAAALRDLPEWRDGIDPETLEMHPSVRRVVDRKLGTDVHLSLLDAACASSLYAAEFGMRLLNAGQIDVAYVGGVFSPGHANAALFSQFGGLSATGCRPLDASADGVIFGEGAAVLVLKRLADAVADGDTIHAVIRSFGLSSDGRTPSVNVPRVAGQALSVRNAYNCGIDPASVQYVEAHATATPVGDATEFASLKEIFGASRRADGPVMLGSVKALLGHTGWLAGAASVIKVCLALAARRLPPQPGFTQPNPRIDLAGSPFAIPSTAWNWPPNTDGEPRRAAVNGFGFGGTNAHVVLDEYDADYHARLIAASGPGGADEIVAVAIGSAFANTEDRWSHLPGRRVEQVSAEALRLPSGKRIMPDVAEQMDTAQFLALDAADQALKILGDLEGWRGRLGVLMGASGKARRGVAANERVFADRLERLVVEHLARRGTAPGAAETAAASLGDALEARNAASNAYTLVGMMPNIVTGRIANLYDLMGANMVIDGGGRSLLDAMRVAARSLGTGACDAVIAGAVNATAAWPRGGRQRIDGGASPDGAVAVLLVTRATAERRGLQPLAFLTVGEIGHDILEVRPAQVGAEAEAVGIDLDSGRPHEVLGLDVFARAVRQGIPSTLRWRSEPADTPARRDDDGKLAPSPVRPDDIDYATPSYVPAPLPASSLMQETMAPPRSFPERVVYLADEAALARGVHRAAGFSGEAVVAGPLPRDAGDGELAAQVGRAGVDGCDVLVVLRDLRMVPADSLLRSETGERMAELAFAAGRGAYSSLADGRTALICVSLGGVLPDSREQSRVALHPEAALLAGFCKSVARELPKAIIRCLAMAGGTIEAAAAAIRAELATTSLDVDLAISAEGERLAMRLATYREAGAGGGPRLDGSSVVLLTGGGRGITAVLAEALMERFGCAIELFGRSDPSAVPADVLAMSDAGFAAYESDFLGAGLAGGAGRMADLKRAYADLAAGRELAANLARLGRLGRANYQAVDVTDAASVDAAVRRIVERHGRLDLVVHGAGVQISKRLARRTLADWRATSGPKLRGLRNLLTAARTHCPAQPEVHLVTSATGPLGNDGQADYGAINSAMGALAVACDPGPAGPRWTALGWLGWREVGMAASESMADVLRARGFRTITSAEGVALFLPLFEHDPRASDAIVLGEGERRLASAIAVPAAASASATVLLRAAASAPFEPAAEAPAAPRAVRRWMLDQGSAPYLAQHLFNGVPSLPGAFELDLAVRTAMAARPDLPFVCVDRIAFTRMLKVPHGRSVQLRVTAVGETGGRGSDTATFTVRLESDFVHPGNGAILQRDVLHAQAQVRLSSQPFPIAPFALPSDTQAELPMTDNYVESGAPLHVGGGFDCLRDIRGGRLFRSADATIGADGFLEAMEDFVAPSLLLDAMLRLGTLVPPGTGELYLPELLTDVIFVPRLNDTALARDGRPLRLVAATPRRLDDRVVDVRCAAMDASGRPIASVGYGQGTRVSRMRHAREAAE